MKFRISASIKFFSWYISPWHLSYLVEEIKSCGMFALDFCNDMNVRLFRFTIAFKLHFSFHCSMLEIKLVAIQIFDS